MPDMNTIVGSHDLLMITLDTLRYDVAKLEEANVQSVRFGSVGEASYPRKFYICRAPCFFWWVHAYSCQYG